MLVLAATFAAASSAPVDVEPAAPSFESHLQRRAPVLSEAGYSVLHRRHQRTVGWGFVVGGVGIPVFATGLTMAAFSLFGGSANGWTALGVNMMGVGIAANVTGTVIATRALTMYDREYKDLRDGRVDVDTLASYRPHCQLRTRMAANGVGGTF